MRIPFHMIKPAALAGALIAGSVGLAAAQTGPANTGSTSRVDPAVPTVNSASPAAQNPYVNPNAAGTQLHRPNMAAPTGPNGAQPGNLLVPDDKGMSAAEARKRIEEKGYGQVSGLRQDRNFWWEGMAMKNGHQVRVAVDHAGNVTEQR